MRRLSLGIVDTDHIANSARTSAIAQRPEAERLPCKSYLCTGRPGANTQLLTTDATRRSLNEEMHQTTFPMDSACRLNGHTIINPRRSTRSVAEQYTCSFSRPPMWDYDGQNRSPSHRLLPYTHSCQAKRCEMRVWRSVKPLQCSRGHRDVPSFYTGAPRVDRNRVGIPARANFQGIAAITSLRCLVSSYRIRPVKSWRRHNHLPIHHPCGSLVTRSSTLWEL
ncbi:hypothetical protein C8Q74DRAFT_1056468 [Fomes fomentarius]|nr:hypothetical protein C8Q74DRAFT_1056468 [Fomes fomentarius]